MRALLKTAMLRGLLFAGLLASGLTSMTSTTASGGPDTDRLGAHLAEHRFVFLGEKHDNPEHHRIQAALLERMIETGRRPAVVWEMITREKQSAIDAFMASGSGDPDVFAEAVEWAESGWPDWRYYRPIAEVALAAGLPMVAGNLDRDTVRAVARGAPLDDDLRSALRLGPALPAPVTEALLDEVYRGHCELVPRDRLAPMVRVQVARDASLAEAAARAGTAADGAVLIVGGQHARKDVGAAYHLRHRFDAEDVLSFTLLELGAAQAADPRLAKRFDYVWFTEQADPDRDYCAELEAHFAKHK